MLGINLASAPKLDAFLAVLSPEFAGQMATQVTVSVPAAAEQARQAYLLPEREDFYLAALHSLLWQLALLPPSLAVVFSALLLHVAIAANAQYLGGGDDLASQCKFSIN